MEHGWKFYTADILVLGISMLVYHVPKNRVGKPCLYPFDEVLGIDRAVHSVLAESSERNDRYFVSGQVQRYGRRVRRHCRFQKTMRGEPDIQLPQLGSGHLGVRIVRLHVPGVVAAHDRYLLLFALERGSAAATWRIVSLATRELFPR